MAKTHTAPVISPSSFDLPLYISEIPQVDLAAALMRNLAGAADFAIVNAARSLFKGVRQEIWLGDCSLDTLADLNSALNEQSFAEDSFKAAGSSNIGNIETIKNLWPLRERWIEQARDLTSLTVNWEGTINKFEPKDIEEQICEPEVNTSKKTIGRIVKQVNRKAEELDIDEEDKARTLKNRLAREDVNNANMICNLKATSQGVLHMLYAAIRIDNEEVVTEINGARKSKENDCHRVAHVAGEPDFHLLPYNLRFKLISETIKHTELQAEWACKNSRMSEDEFDTFDMLCSKSMKALRSVISSPQFRTALAQLEASDAMTG